jgi:hypothetical protein
VCVIYALLNRVQSEQSRYYYITLAQSTSTSHGQWAWQKDGGGEGGAAIYPFTRLSAFQDRGFLDGEPVLERLSYLARPGNTRQ